MHSGVRQGCPPLAPVLQRVEGLHLPGDRRLQQGQGAGLTATTGGSRCSATMHLLMLLYTDDVVLLPPSATALRTALQAMQSTASAWGMQLSHAETIVMVGAPDQAWAEATAAAEGAAAAATTATTVRRGRQQQPCTQRAPCTLGAHATLGLVASCRYQRGLSEASGSQERELARRPWAAGGAFKQLETRVLRCRRVGLGSGCMCGAANFAVVVVTVPP
jgi:hypothetical protein